MAIGNQLTFNKDAFFRDLGYVPHEGQAAVHASKAHRRICACGVRWGKTRCAAMEGLASALEPKDRSMGWVVAPTYDLADKVYRELVLIATSHLQHRLVTLKENDRKLVLRNMAGGLSEIRGKSADNPISLLGEGLDWVIVDEAARLKPAIWEGHVTQRLLDKNGWALLISTPRGKGWFYDLYRRGQGQDPDYASWNHPSRSNPYLNAELIEHERSRLPERVFKQEYEGAFLEGAGAVFRNVRDLARGEFREAVENATYYAGLDLAKIEDFTVLVVLDRDCKVVFVDRFNRVDWEIQVQRIKAASDRFNRPKMFVDSTGSGEPVYENLRRAGLFAEAYPFTAKSKDALVNNLAILFEKKVITLPRPDLWPEGIDELEGFEYSITDSGNVKTGAPSGVHDDCVIALALAGWHFQRPKNVETDWSAVARKLGGSRHGFVRVRTVVPWNPKGKQVVEEDVIGY